jgi:hypothetical protein
MEMLEYQAGLTDCRVYKRLGRSKGTESASCGKPINVAQRLPSCVALRPCYMSNALLTGLIRIRPPKNTYLGRRYGCPRLRQANASGLIYNPH